MEPRRLPGEEATFRLAWGGLPRAALLVAMLAAAIGWCGFRHELNLAGQHQDAIRLAADADPFLTIVYTGLVYAVAALYLRRAL